jgi:hypothetical protein
MSSIVDSLTEIYVFVADFLAEHPNLAAWRYSNNREPAFTDAEVLTIGLMQGVFGVATLKQTYRLIANNWRSAFPHLCSYAQWLARLHRLSPLVNCLIQEALRSHKMPGCLYLLDSKPIPVCKPIRHGRVRLLRDEGAYFGKNSVGWFFGFKLHALVHHSGAILAVLFTPANTPDKNPDVMHQLISVAAGGAVLVDLGYKDKALVAELQEEYGVTILNPQEAGDKRTLISSLRERVETTYSSLYNRFVDRVLSRSWQGLWNTVLLKVLHYNLCQAGWLH